MVYTYEIRIVHLHQATRNRQPELRRTVNSLCGVRQQRPTQHHHSNPMEGYQ